MEEHNLALVEAIRGGAHLTITDYIENGILSRGGAFDYPQRPVGNWRVNAHNGIDGVGGFAKTPFYTRYAVPPLPDRNSNPITLEIIGTAFRMQIIHGDEKPVSALTVGTIFAPGQEILPFPDNLNGAGTAPHFHFQIAENESHFVNPLTLDPSDRIFQFSRDGGDTWTDFNVGF
jgi:hypothetical protein